MDTPHPKEIVKYCPHCRCKTWTDVNGICEWADMHREPEPPALEQEARGCDK